VVKTHAYSAIVTQIDVFVDLYGNAIAALFQDQVFGADAGNQRLADRYVNAIRQPFSERSGGHPTMSINRRFEAVHGADECGDEQRCRISVQLLGRIDLLYHSSVHDRDSVGD